MHEPARVCASITLGGFDDCRDVDLPTLYCVEEELGADDGYGYLVSLHLKGGGVETAPYRTLAEAKYVASLFERLAGGASLEPPGVPFVYVFPPEEKIIRVELHAKRVARAL